MPIRLAPVWVEGAWKEAEPAIRDQPVLGWQKKRNLSPATFFGSSVQYILQETLVVVGVIFRPGGVGGGELGTLDNLFAVSMSREATIEK